MITRLDPIVSEESPVPKTDPRAATFAAGE